MKKTIVLTAVGSAGDIHPLIALGRGLKQNGHSPVLAVNAHYQPLVIKNGLDFIQLGSAEQYLQITQNPDLWHPTKSFQVLVDYSIGPFIRPLYDSLTQFDPASTVVAASGFMYGARLAYEKLGLPWLSLHLQPALFRTAYDVPPLGTSALPGWLPPAVKRGYFNLLDALLIDGAIGAKVNPVRRELGLPPQSHFLGESFHSPLKSIGLFPDWFAPPQPDWPPQIELTGFVRFDGGETAVLPSELAAFLQNGEPPLVFTAGSAMRHGARFFTESAAAAQKLGRRAVLVARDATQIPANLPETVLHVTYVPFSLLLPHAAALVHHGGIGTVAQALAAGVPQLVMPMSHDQPDNARRLKQLGVADVLRPNAYVATAVAAKLDHLLQSAQTKQQCQKWAGRVDFAAALQQTCHAITH
ncbi:MAG: glycosyltransferase family 1 protein [Ardenticatenaceae bacterium]|nr:glycosyltransferase family 1 protein [Anaerolineales bacterium]MCB8979842.1 glycosyltransferase family 1 protein [Ardenticatenaceae bacterium]